MDQPAVDGAPPEAPAKRNYRSICESRGYCGPFENEEVCTLAGGERCGGRAICIHCSRAVDVSAELERWEGALWERVFGMMLRPLPSPARPPRR